MRTGKIEYDIFTNVGNAHIKPMIWEIRRNSSNFVMRKKYKGHMARMHAAATNGEHTNIKLP